MIYLLKTLKETIVNGILKKYIIMKNVNTPDNFKIKENLCLKYFLHFLSL